MHEASASSRISNLLDVEVGKDALWLNPLNPAIREHWRKPSKKNQFPLSSRRI